MKIKVAKHAGYCYGVKNAIQLAMDHAKQIPLYSLGELIHNRVAVSNLNEAGIRAVHDVDELKSGQTVVIRAHGIGPKTVEALKNKNISVVDATCPFVQRIHRIVQKARHNQHFIIIVGDRNHPEVIGINGWCDDQAWIISEEDDMEKIESLLEKESGKQFTVVAQTTQNVNFYNKIKIFLSNLYEKIDFYDTICNTTMSRQDEAAKIAEDADIMFVIGSSHSANSKQLYHICKEKCAYTFLVEKAEDIPLDICYKMKIIGITAGASTPEEVIKEVIGSMEELNKEGIENNNNEVSFKEALEDSLVTLRTGQIVKGKVISYNADKQEVYVDLGFKIDGTVPFHEFSDDKEFDPEEMIVEGQEIEVLVMRVNDSEGSVSLSKKKVDNRKKWKKIESIYKNQETLTVRVTEVIKGGLLAKAEGQEIFIPASQVSDRFIRNLNKFVDTDLDIRIIELNRRRKKVVGSARIIIEEERAKAEKEVWENIEKGKVYNGIVKSITDFGVFVDIGGIDGLVHISELSWEKINHPSDVAKKGQEMEVFVLDFDQEAKKISLGYRKEEDNPWYNAEEKFAVGKTIKGKVVRIVPFGAFVEIEKGIDGLVHISQISTVRINKVEDVLSVGEEVESKIIETDLPHRKISLSIKEVSPIEPPYAQDIMNTDVAFDEEDDTQSHQKQERSSASRERFERFEKPSKHKSERQSRQRNFDRQENQKPAASKNDFKRPSRHRKPSRNMPDSVIEHKEELDNTIGDLLQGLKLDLLEAEKNKKQEEKKQEETKPENEKQEQEQEQEQEQDQDQEKSDE